VSRFGWLRQWFGRGRVRLADGERPVARPAWLALGKGHVVDVAARFDDESIANPHHKDTASSCRLVPSCDGGAATFCDHAVTTAVRELVLCVVLHLVIADGYGRAASTDRVREFVLNQTWASGLIQRIRSVMLVWSRAMSRW
jgi:hypothetical protein